MSEPKKRYSPWVAAVVLGVMALLFSIYAIQSQSETAEGRVKIEQLEQQVKLCQKTAEEQAMHAMKAQQMAQAAAEHAMMQLEECLKQNKKK